MITISFTNNKGGVGKSTSAVSVAAYSALHGKKTLLIDLDPQGNSTSSLINKASVKRTMLDSFNDGEIKSNIMNTNIENLYIIPSNLTLDSANMSLASAFKREELLKKLLTKIDNDFDICIIDTCPALNILTFNALVASDSLYIPVRAGGYELEGMRNLMKVIKEVKDFNIGIFFTQYQANQNMTKMIKEEIEKEFGPMMKNSIRQNVALVEAPILKESIFTYMPNSNGAIDYNNLCEEIFEREGIEIKKTKKRGRKVKDGEKIR